MSRTKFLDAADVLGEWRQKNNLPQIHYLQLFAEVRDRWIEEKRYRDLIAFINDEWDSGNSDDFIAPLEIKLIDAKEAGYFKQLWKGMIRHRLNTLWNHYKRVTERDPKVTSEIIASINSKDFDFTTKDSDLLNQLFFDDIRKVLAYYRQFTLNGLNKYKSGLQKLNEQEEIERVDRLIDTVTRLQKPIPKPSTDKGKIDEPLFWSLISEARRENADKYQFIENLKSSLETFRPEELKNFQKILMIKFTELNLWDLWALAYIVKRGCSDDGFDYFRLWVISKGKHAFDIILSLNEEGLKSVFDEDPRLEELMSSAQEIYEDKTGDIMLPVKVKQHKIKGTEWSEENLQSIFPKLCKLFDFTT